MADARSTPTGPVLALASALLFGLSAPAAKLLVATADPWLLAGLLYLGSGVGLGLYRLLGPVIAPRTPETPLRSADVPWLVVAIATGGVIGPVLLMLGLAAGPAAQSSLLLNLEGVFTVLLAWLVFREHVGPRIALGMGAITLGAVVLTWEPPGVVVVSPSALLVAGACLAWAIDNNVTRRIATGDAVLIAALKGAGAGIVNVALALLRGAELPSPAVTLAAGLVGFLGYGTSLVLFVLALRHLGTARTGAYFSTAPFLGALSAVVALHEPVTGRLGVAAACMALGVWLHLGERHDHDHLHEPLGHEHRHRHDEHHEHAHEAGHPPGEPHSHWHVHARLRHRHPHYPDVHHRHGH